MKLTTLLNITLAAMIAGAFAGCGGTVDEDENSTEALSTRYTDNRDFDEFTGVVDIGTVNDGSGVGGIDTGGEVFATFTCRADAGSGCTNFGIACEGNGGKLTNSADGLISTCNCDIGSDGKANPQAAACNSALSK